MEEAEEEVGGGRRRRSEESMKGQRSAQTLPLCAMSERLWMIGLELTVSSAKRVMQCRLKPSGSTW